MKSTIEKSDSDLKNDILSELKFEPNVRSTDIGVLVNHGTVTLNGFATSYDTRTQFPRAKLETRGCSHATRTLVRTRRSLAVRHFSRAPRVSLAWLHEQGSSAAKQHWAWR